MSKRTRDLITLLGIMFVGQFCAAQAITVAAAADLQFAMQTAQDSESPSRLFSTESNLDSCPSNCIPR
jgi:hypothetical protein